MGGRPRSPWQVNGLRDAAGMAAELKPGPWSSPELPGFSEIPKIGNHVAAPPDPNRSVHLPSKQIPCTI